MSRKSINITWTKKQREALQPLFDAIRESNRLSDESDGLLGQVYETGMQVRYIENKDVMQIQKINRIAQKQGRQEKC